MLGAWDGELLVGTVTLLLDFPPNQPHRAEIAKMMTRPSHRGRGIASTLMRAAEDLARQHGRTLLVLDTAAEEGASGLYERLGFTLAGEIPDYALKPHGGLTATKNLLEEDRSLVLRVISRFPCQFRSRNELGSRRMRRDSRRK